MKGSDYFSFIFNLVRENGYNSDKVVLIADNLKCHKLKGVFKKAQKFINLEFISRYSPMLNPIEYFFSLLKRHLRKKV